MKTKKQKTKHTNIEITDGLWRENLIAQVQDDGRFPERLMAIVSAESGQNENGEVYYATTNPNRLVHPGRFRLIGIYKLQEVAELSAELRLAQVRKKKR